LHIASGNVGNVGRGEAAQLLKLVTMSTAASPLLAIRMCKRPQSLILKQYNSFKLHGTFDDLGSKDVGVITTQNCDRAGLMHV
jgi:hypothetical protein